MIEFKHFKQLKTCIYIYTFKELNALLYFLIFKHLTY